MTHSVSVCLRLTKKYTLISPCNYQRHPLHLSHFGNFSKRFLLDRGLFCRATRDICFGLRITLPMGFKARVDFGNFSHLAFYSDTSKNETYLKERICIGETH